jgi:hypothetical protein
VSDTEKRKANCSQTLRDLVTLVKGAPQLVATSPARLYKTRARAVALTRHSYLKATIGSTREARRAGMYVAINATTARSAPVPA